MKNMKIKEDYEEKIKKLEDERIMFICIAFIVIALIVLIVSIQSNSSYDYCFAPSNVSIPPKQITNEFCEYKGFNWGDINTAECYGIHCYRSRGGSLGAKCIDFDEYEKYLAGRK